MRRPNSGRRRGTRSRGGRSRGGARRAGCALDALRVVRIHRRAYPSVAMQSSVLQYTQHEGGDSPRRTAGASGPPFTAALAILGLRQSRGSKCREHGAVVEEHRAEAVNGTTHPAGAQATLYPPNRQPRLPMTQRCFHDIYIRDTCTRTRRTAPSHSIAEHQQHACMFPSRARARVYGGVLTVARSQS